MRVINIGMLIVIVTLAVACMWAGADEAGDVPLYSYTVENIDGATVALATYKGDVLLIVNVASRCGFTGQYADLEKLYEKYKDKGFKILAFPANDFLNQEPGTNKEINEFCSTTYGVTFDMFAKIHVKGNEMHPLYVFLTHHQQFGGAITWNFNKFLVDREGHVVARFETRTKPLSDDVIGAIEKVL